MKTLIFIGLKIAELIGLCLAIAIIIAIIFLVGFLIVMVFKEYIIPSNKKLTNKIYDKYFNK